MITAVYRQVIKPGLFTHNVGRNEQTLYVPELRSQVLRNVQQQSVVGHLWRLRCSGSLGFFGTNYRVDGQWYLNHCLLLIAICVVAVLTVPAVAQDVATPATLGLVAEAPADGRSVKCNAGFMVAYSQPIPGTDVSFEMVPIPGGTYQMGSPAAEPDRKDDEGPQVTVCVQPFWMGKYEVTWLEYQEFMKLYDLFKKLQSRELRTVTEENQVDAITIPTPLYDPSFTYALGEESQQPAVTMSQYAAKQYTKWLSRLTDNFYRLPAEAEWEHACRAGTKTAFSFGDDPKQLDDHAVYFENSDDLTSEVGKKQPNPWGLFDMHGNVREIVLDLYEEDHYEKLSQLTADGKKALTVEQTIVWPDKIFQRVTRGGSWEDDPEGLRSAARSATDDWRTEDPNLPKSPWWFTDEEALAVGFRVIRPLDPPAAEQREKFWEPDAERLKIAIDNRMAEGKGVYGLVDPKLPEDLEKIR